MLAMSFCITVQFSLITVSASSAICKEIWKLLGLFTGHVSFWMLRELFQSLRFSVSGNNFKKQLNELYLTVLLRFCYCCDCRCSKELKEGIEILTAKIQKFKPKIAVFNGKGKTCICIFCFYHLTFVIV